MYQARFYKQDLWKPVLIIIGWALYCVFFASQAYIQQAYAGRNGTWQNYFIPWMICSSIWALLTPLILGLAARFPLTLKRWRRGLLVHVPAAAALSCFQLGLYVVVWNLLFDPKPRGPLEQYK